MLPVDLPFVPESVDADESALALATLSWLNTTQSRVLWVRRTGPLLRFHAFSKQGVELGTLWWFDGSWNWVPHEGSMVSFPTLPEASGAVLSGTNSPATHMALAPIVFLLGALILGFLEAYYAAAGVGLSPQYLTAGASLSTMANSIIAAAHFVAAVVLSVGAFVLWPDRA